MEDVQHSFRKLFHLYFETIHVKTITQLRSHSKLYGPRRRFGFRAARNSIRCAVNKYWTCISNYESRYAESAFARCTRGTITGSVGGVKVAVALETADLGVCKIRKVLYRKTAALPLQLLFAFLHYS